MRAPCLEANSWWGLRDGGEPLASAPPGAPGEGLPWSSCLVPPRNLKAISVQNQFLIQSKFCCDTLKLMGLWFSMNTCCQCSESCLQLLPAPAGSPAPALQGVGAVCYLLPPAGAPRPDRGNPKTLWLGCWLCPIPRMVSADTEVSDLAAHRMVWARRGL